MSSLNWGFINDGGVFESLMHSVLYAEDPETVLFGRPGKDSGQDARSSDGTTVYQAKYRQGLNMDGAISIALEELERIKIYREVGHSNHQHWAEALNWVLVANFSINPNDDAKWQTQVVPAFRAEGLAPTYWHIETLEGKLAEYSEIREVFFGGENRVLIGLKEAHQLLSAECVGSRALEVPMLGRDDELQVIQTFASTGEGRILPIIGPGGIGKSRLLYEGLIRLAQDGWRVLWGLSGTMAQSSQWFRLLNGSQRTCVVLDSPDDAGLLRSLIEQLSATERRNWRVLIALRSENTGAIRPFSSNKNLEKPIHLKPINEELTHALANSCLDNPVSAEWLHAVYNLTRGVPGWVCLIATLANEGKLSTLPANADEIASIYIDSCLSTLNTESREQALTLIRWLSIWGSLSIESSSSDLVQAELSHLESEGIPQATTRELLKQLTNAGLVRNWGVNQRLYAVDPLILRQQILHEWLFRKNGGVHEVSDAGSQLVQGLITERIPSAESILGTLSHFALSRLEENETDLLLGPIFNAIGEVVRNGSIIDQYNASKLISKAGAADPESAFFVLKDIRENVKDSVEVNHEAWYKETFTHVELLGKLPWILFQVAEHVTDSNLGRHIINEFRLFIELEQAGNLNFDPGNEPATLFKRLLSKDASGEVFCRPAYELFAAELSNPENWPIVKTIARCLMEPIRESTSWTRSYTLTFQRRAIHPESSEWQIATDVRGSILAQLRESTVPDFRIKLWRVFSESHHAFHRAVLHGFAQGDIETSYRELILSDLSTCLDILKSPPLPLTIEETTVAREVWDWYLDYGKDDELVELAQECEAAYNDFPCNKWRLHEFFCFETDEKLAPETERIVTLFREASNPEVFSGFFDQVVHYLEAARGGGQDLADLWRMTELANGCGDMLQLDEVPSNTLTEYVKYVLEEDSASNSYAWDFSTKICKAYLLASKSDESRPIETAMAQVLSITANPSRLLWDIYANVHPQSIGQLTRSELENIKKYQADFSLYEWFYLMGAFYVIDANLIRQNLEELIDGAKEDLDKASNYMAHFVKSVDMSAIRYDWQGHQLPVSWILRMISVYKLDSALLDMHDLKTLRDKADFRLNMAQTKELISSRIELEQGPKPSEDYKVAPHDFCTSRWCHFDSSIPEELDAFNEFCELAMGATFTASYWMPKYIAHLDCSGEHLTAFMIQYLSQNPEADVSTLSRLGNIASAFGEGSSAWAKIASPICSKAEATLRKKDRNEVYFGLSRKETGVITSAIGEVPNHYIEAEKQAQRLFDDEPANSSLRGYREWALKRAKYDLRRAQEQAEEDRYE